MIGCGELCKTCSRTCAIEVSKCDPIEIECPLCSGLGCDSCTEGAFRVEMCPNQYVGQQMIYAINLAALAKRGSWPVAGGTLDQSAWFVELVQTFESETTHIENEKLAEAKRRG